MRVFSNERTKNYAVLETHTVTALISTVYTSFIDIA